MKVLGIWISGKCHDPGSVTQCFRFCIIIYPRFCYDVLLLVSWVLILYFQSWFAFVIPPLLGLSASLCASCFSLVVFSLCASYSVQLSSCVINLSLASHLLPLSPVTLCIWCLVQSAQCRAVLSYMPVCSVRSIVQFSSVFISASNKAAF